jgi:hypothetical protein
MTDTFQIEIPLSKKKMFLTLFGAIVFVILGFCFLFYPPQIDNPFLGNSIIIFLSGLASIIFFWTYCNYNSKENF